MEINANIYPIPSCIFPQLFNYRTILSFIILSLFYPCLSFKHVTYYTTCIWYSTPTYNNKLLFTVKYDQNTNLIGDFNMI